jgi:hypothetical protein
LKIIKPISDIKIEDEILSLDESLLNLAVIEILNQDISSLQLLGGHS